MIILPVSLLLLACRTGSVLGHGGNEDERSEIEIPLHEREWVQDSAEELERKWSFEVSHVTFLLCNSDGEINEEIEGKRRRNIN
jgi:hypothetical protein